MVQAKTRFKTIEEYAALETSDLPECPYELVDGVIVEMGAENDRNVQIAGFLYVLLAQLIPFYLIRRGSEIAVSSQSVTSRFPDLMVITEAAHAGMDLDRRSLITQTMPAPVLVVEIVSPGKPTDPNYQRDYVHKRREYAARGIPEYWLIDPSRHLVMVLQLNGGQYQENIFRDDESIISPSFPTLKVTANQVLNAGQ